MALYSIRNLALTNQVRVRLVNQQRINMAKGLPHQIHVMLIEYRRRTLFKFKIVVCLKVASINPFPHGLPRLNGNVLLYACIK